jgi:hypothetical protein
MAGAYAFNMPNTHCASLGAASPVYTQAFPGDAKLYWPRPRRRDASDIYPQPSLRPGATGWN